MIKKITWTWKKLVAVVMGFLGIGTLVSCYGMPIDYNNFEVSGTVYGDIDGDGINEPIPGIGVSIDNKPSAYNYDSITGADGKFIQNSVFPTFDDVSNLEYTLYFTDIDDEENGSFEDKSVTFKLKEMTSGKVKLGEIILERKTEEPEDPESPANPMID